MDDYENNYDPPYRLVPIDDDYDDDYDDEDDDEYEIDYDD